MSDSPEDDDRETWAVIPADEVLAMVRTAPVPEIPFADLADSLVARTDANGVLTDWWLDVSSESGGSQVGTYWRWRRTWSSWWPIGNVASLRVLHRWITTHAAITAPVVSRILETLLTSDEGPVLVPIVAHDSMLDELGMLERWFASERESVHPDAAPETAESPAGIGIVDDMPSPRRTAGLARTWTMPSADVVVSATTTTAVILRPGIGLVVRHLGDDVVELESIASVDLRNEPAVVVGSDGRQLTMSLHDARPLGWLVPRSLRWHIRPLLWGEVWTSLTAGLASAVTAAENAASHVELSTRSPLVEHAGR